MPIFRSRAVALAFASLAGLAGACTPADGPEVQTARAEGRQCFLPREVNGFSAPDDNAVFVTVGANTLYRLEIVGVCPEIDWSQRIGIRSLGGGSWICQGLDAEIIVPTPNGTQRCPVTGVRRLTDEEARAYRESH